MERLCWFVMSVGLVVTQLHVAVPQDIDEELAEQEGPLVCADFIFVVQNSCNIDIENKENAVRAMKMIAKMLMGNNRARMALITYSSGSQEVIGLTNVADFLTQLNDTNIVSADSCEYLKAELYDGLARITTDSYFKEVVHSVTEKPIVRSRIVVVFGDGISFDRKANMVEAYDRTVVEINRLKSLYTRMIHFHMDVSETGDDRKAAQELQHYDVKLSFLEDPHTPIDNEMKRSTCDKADDPEPCRTALDVVFVIDRSMSIKIEDIKFIKDFFKNVAEKLMGLSPRTRIGALSYNRYMIKEFSLCEHTTLEEIIQGIDAIPEETGKYTHTHQALYEAAFGRGYLGNTTGNPPCNRPELANIIICATDGRTWLAGSSKPISRYTIANAQKIYDKQPDTSIMGVLLPNKKNKTDGILEWQDVTTPDKIFDLQTKAYTPDSFKILLTKVDDIVGLACTNYRKEQEKNKLPYW